MNYLDIEWSEIVAKRKRSYTLTEQADDIITAIADRLGISKTAVIEISVREKFENLGMVDAGKIKVRYTDSESKE